MTTTDPAPKLIAVDFACNDPASGIFEGKAWMGSIDGNDIERSSGEVRFHETATGFTIHRKKFAVHDSKEWVGNWCWNRYWLTVKEARKLVEHLRKNGWECTCGDERFYDAFNRPQTPVGE